MGFYLKIVRPDRQAEILIVALIDVPESYQSHGRARTLLRPKRAINRGGYIAPPTRQGMNDLQICRELSS